MNKLGFAVVLALASACGDGHEPGATTPDAGGTDTPDPVERGQYIMNVLGECTFCHTPLLPNGQRDLDNLFAGVDCFADIDSLTFQDNGNGQGCISTRNLTNHATGLANATDAQIKDAFLNGIRTDGKKIVPIMPWTLFHNMTDEDADAVVAYLRTVPGKNHQVKANEPPFSFYNDGIATTLPPFIMQPAAPVAEAEIPMPRGGVNNQSAMRGRYLASSTGLCIDCHSVTVTPISIDFDKSKFFGGGRVFTQAQLGFIDPAFPPAVAARNITPHASGLGGWTKAQIKAAIKQGKDRDGNQVCAGTHGGLVAGYAALTEQDVDDIAEYIMNIPPVDNDAAASNCGPPPFPLAAPDPETDAECGNFQDDDGDQVPDDGCYIPCGNCAGPPVP
jgi:mono/diheme cytochrome c family protein